MLPSLAFNSNCMLLLNDNTRCNTYNDDCYTKFIK
uniref:Uncharacterized protein n=1 Tax=Brugia malayi TaxID=6279 RepID=A8Q240_BRUMA